MASMMEIKRMEDYCPNCEKEHTMDIVRLSTSAMHKGIMVSYTATYQRCPYSGITYETVDMAKENRKSEERAYQIVCDEVNKKYDMLFGGKGG